MIYCLFFIAHVQHESAEAAAVQVGTTGHKVPGHTGYPSVWWEQDVLWAANHHPKQQEWSQLQLRGGDVLRLVGKSTERSQGWRLPWRKAAGVYGGMRDCWESAMVLVPVRLCVWGREAPCFMLMKLWWEVAHLKDHEDALLSMPKTCPPRLC